MDTSRKDFDYRQLVTNELAEARSKIRDNIIKSELDIHTKAAMIRLCQNWISQMDIDIHNAMCELDNMPLKLRRIMFDTEFHDEDINPNRESKCPGCGSNTFHGCLVGCKHPDGCGFLNIITEGKY